MVSTGMSRRHEDVCDQGEEIIFPAGKISIIYLLKVTKE